MSIHATPKGERIHIALLGRRNAGKSSLINAITGQDASIVSEIKGTTTDPVYKAMELLPLGPVMFVDTPGLDDEGSLGKERVKKAQRVLDKTDLALVVADGEDAANDFSLEKDILAQIEKKKIPAIVVLNKQDKWKNKEAALSCHGDICVSAKSGYHIAELKEMIAAKMPSDEPAKKLAGDLVSSGDFAILVTPIDKAAPKGRLILPQQQVIRDLLDSGAVPVICRDTELKSTLRNLGRVPAIVITDSQAFATVSKEVPEHVPLTSFSILFSRYKGDLEEQIRGVHTLKKLQDGDTLLMAEGCTHHRQCGDIGTVKLPHWIQNYTGKNLYFETCSGNSYPEDLSRYALIVHCGGCTLPKKEMAFRINEAKSQNIPIVNYGTMIAGLNGVLKRSIEPFPYYRELL